MTTRWPMRGVGEAADDLDIGLGVLGVGSGRGVTRWKPAMPQPSQKRTAAERSGVMIEEVGRVRRTRMPRRLAWWMSSSRSSRAGSGSGGVWGLVLGWVQRRKARGGEDEGVDAEGAEGVEAVGEVFVVDGEVGCGDCGVVGVGGVSRELRERRLCRRRRVATTGRR